MSRPYLGRVGDNSLRSPLGRFSGSSVESSPNAQEAMHVQIELLVQSIADLNPKMKEKILEDLYLAGVGTARQVEEARGRLVKAGVPKQWSPEILGKIRNRCGQSGSEVVNGPEATEARRALDGLFPSETKPSGK